MPTTYAIPLAAAVALTATTSPAAAQGAPFGSLHAPPDVVTSASEEAIWFGLDPTAYMIRLPEGFQARNSAAEEGLNPGYVPSVGIHCRRATPGSEEADWQRGLYVEIVIPRMEDDPTAALAMAFDPRYWLRELTGEAVREVPLQVAVDGGPPTATNLRIHRTDYSAPRPHLYAYLPERQVLERVSRGRPWTLEAVGEEAAFTMRFPPGPESVRAGAQRVLEICLEGGS